MRTILFLTLFISFLYQVAAARDIVAVKGLSTTGVTEGEAGSLTDALRSEIGKTGVFDVMERSQMEEILKEQGFQASGACDEAQCAVEIGKLLSVKFMIMGNVGKVGQTYTLNARLVDVQTGRIIKDVTELQKGSPDVLLTRSIPNIVKEMVGAGTTPTDAKPKSKKFPWLAVGGIAAVAVAVPVAYFVIKGSTETDTTYTTEIITTW